MLPFLLFVRLLLFVGLVDDQRKAKATWKVIYEIFEEEGL